MRFASNLIIADVTHFEIGRPLSKNFAHARASIQFSRDLAREKRDDHDTEQRSE